MNRPPSWFRWSALGCLVSIPGIAVQAGPTFHKDIVPIFQNKCQECHRPEGINVGGMVAPMSLVTYDEVRPWVKSVVREIKAGRMPPWNAAPEFHGVFSNERSLTPAEIETISSWAASGAPAGRPEDAPPPKEFKNTGGWMIGEPDLIVTIPKPYTIGDDGVDQYTAHVVDLTDAMLPEDAYISAFQCKPGVKIIHHFNAHLLAPVNGVLPPPPTTTESDAISPKGAGIYIGGVSSGTEANVYPEGYGLPLKKGTRVTFDVHYHKEAGPGTAVTDSTSQIGFKFTKSPPRHAITGLSIMNFQIAIKPGEDGYKIGPVSRPMTKDTWIVSLMPHMHMRGKAAKFEAFYPDGAREVLLDVPAYDFSWQTVYYYKGMKRIPKGTRIEYTAWYDNSEEYGKLRKFDWTQPVKYGPSSTDEMMMGFLMAAPVEE